MSEIVKKQVCKCENCGNEAEMMVTCSLEDHVHADPEPSKTPDKSLKPAEKIKGTATCTNCGNEADMWVDL